MMMNENKLNHLVDETAELMRLFQNQCQTLGNRTDERIMSHLDLVRGEIVKTVHSDVKEGLENTIRSYQKSLDESRQNIIKHTREFNAYLQETATKNRQLARLSWIITAVSLVVMLIGSIALSFYYKSIIEGLKPEAEIVRLIKESDITRCGDYLCVKIEKTRHGNYFVVKKHSLGFSGN